MASNWLSRPIKIVGVHISYNSKLNNALNFASPLKQMDRILAAWHSRPLTLLGKIQIRKTFALSQLTYVYMRMASTTTDILHKVEQTVFKFLWNGRDKIARKVMVKEISEGGLNAPDIKSTHKLLRINLIKRYLRDDINHPWKLFLYQRLKSVGGKYLFKCNFDLKSLQLKLPLFYQEALEAWSYSNIQLDNTELDIAIKPEYLE